MSGVYFAVRILFREKYCFGEPSSSMHSGGSGIFTNIRRCVVSSSSGASDPPKVWPGSAPPFSGYRFIDSALISVSRFRPASGPGTRWVAHLRRFVPDEVGAVIVDEEQKGNQQLGEVVWPVLMSEECRSSKYILDVECKMKGYSGMSELDK